MASDSDSNGTQPSANGEGSDKGSNQTGGSAQPTVTIEQLNQLLDQKLEAFRRSTQSEKDKAVKQTNQRLESVEGSLKEVLQAAASKGQSLSDLLGQLDQDEEVQARQATLELARAYREGKLFSPSGGTEQKKGVDVGAVVQDLELPADDIRVKAFMAQSYQTADEAYREAAKVLKSISRQPTDADAPGSENTRQPNPPKQEQLMAEYKEGSKSLYGMELVKFKQKMRDKGLQIS